MVFLRFECEPNLVQACFHGDADEVRSLLYKKEDVNYQDIEKRTPLHAAAFCGEAEICKLLLLNGARINSKDSKWLTPLHRACFTKSDNVVDILLRNQADVNARDKVNYQTPLHVAASNNAVKCAELLLVNISNINISDRTGRTSLHHAAVNGHIEMVKLLLEKGASLNVLDKKDRRPLHWAAFMGHVEVVRLLISFGAEIGCRDKQSYTPLHAASTNGQLNVVRLLLEFGVDINAVNEHGNTCVHLACLNGQEVVLKELLDHNAANNNANNKGMTPMHCAAIATQGEACLEILINEKIYIDSQTVDSKTPLHMTTMHGYASRAELFLINDASVNTVDSNGNSLLHTAAAYGYYQLIEIFIKHGADIHRRGYYGMLPIHLACMHGHLECFRLLLHVAVKTKETSKNDLLMEDVQIGENITRTTSLFNVNVVDDLGRSCLHTASIGGNVGIVNLLVESGASLEMSDNDGRTPLHYASALGNHNCVMSLVTAKAEAGALDAWGRTPLHYAAAFDQDGRIVEYFLHNNVGATCRDNEGYTPTHYSAFYGKRASLEILLDITAREVMNKKNHQNVYSPLHLAAYNNHLEALNTIASYAVNLDVQDSKGRSALHLAAARGNVCCCEVLLSNGASPRLQDLISRATPLHIAAWYNHLDCVKTILKEEDRDLVDCLDRNNRTPLMLASIGDNVEVVALLLDNAADVNAVDCLKRTSLHYAALNGNESTVSILLQKEISLDEKDLRGFTPMHLAAMFGHVGTLGLLLQGGCNIRALDDKEYSSLHWACFNGHETCVDLLLEHYVKNVLIPNLSTMVLTSDSKLKCFFGNKFTPLHCSAITGNDTCSELIFDLSTVDVLHSRDDFGRTPMHAAVYSGRVETLKMFMNKDCDLSLFDNNNRSVFMHACILGALPIVEFMLESSNDLGHEDIDHNTSLHLACIHKHQRIALKLLEKIEEKNIINKQNTSGRTPLHYACQFGLVQVVNAMLEKDINIFTADNHGTVAALSCIPDKNVAECFVTLLRQMVKRSDFMMFFDRKSSVQGTEFADTSTHYSTEDKQECIQSSDSEFY